MDRMPLVEAALSWAFQQNYTPYVGRLGAAVEYAKATGTIVAIRDMGLYNDVLDFLGVRSIDHLVDAGVFFEPGSVVAVNGLGQFGLPREDQLT